MGSVFLTVRQANWAPTGSPFCCYAYASASSCLFLRVLRTRRGDRGRRRFPRGFLLCSCPHLRIATQFFWVESQTPAAASLRPSALLSQVAVNPKSQAHPKALQQSLKYGFEKSALSGSTVSMAPHSGSYPCGAPEPSSRQAHEPRKELVHLLPAQPFQSVDTSQKPERFTVVGLEASVGAP